MTRCLQCGEANPARARFCIGCGSPVTTRPPAHAVRKVVTVLFADVVGSTALGEDLDPEALRALLGRYFAEMRDAITRHGGTVEKFIGDAVMAVFGVPQAHEDDALRAVRAALDLGEGIARLNDEFATHWDRRLQLRVGVNTGTVMVGGASTDTLVTGDAVNVAARLEQAAAPGTVLIGPVTRALVGARVHTVALDPLTVKGKAEPLVCHRVEGLTEAEGAFPAARTAFVGRSREQALVEWVFERVVQERTFHLLTVLGESGVGKSRLVQETARAMAGRAVVAAERCPPYGDGIGLWPLTRVLRSVAGLADGDSAAVVRSKLAAVVGDDRPSQQRVAEAVAGLVGLDEPPPVASDTAWAVRTFLEAAARREPLVVVLDDLHWAQPALLDLVELIAGQTRDVPLLLCAVARPELVEQRPGWSGGKLNATSIVLPPLRDDDAEVMIGGLLGDVSVDARTTAYLVRTAAGNPLFLEELVAKLTADGTATVDDAVATYARTNRAPTSVQALLAARLEQLGVEDRDVLEHAAVLGESFDRGTLAGLLPEAGRAALDEQLDRLVARDFLRPDPFAADEGVFAFRHVLLRDAVYFSLPRRLRAELHERHADSLGSAPPGAAHARDEILAYHLERAVEERLALSGADPAVPELAARAAKGLATAARRAHARGDSLATVQLLRRALRLPFSDARTRSRLLTELAPALVGIGELVEADAVLDRAREVSGGDPGVLAHVALTRLWTRASTDVAGWADEAEAGIDQAIRTFTEQGDASGLARAWALRSELHYLHGRVADVERALRQSTIHARAAGDLREEAENAAVLAFTAVDGPLPVAEGIARCEALLERFAASPAMQARTQRALGVLHAMAGDADRARELVAACAACFAELSQPVWLAVTRATEGRIALVLDDRRWAEQALRTALASFRDVGDESQTALVMALLVAALDPVADAEEMAALAQESRRTSADADIEAQVQWRLAATRVALAAGRADEGVGQVTEAVRRAEVTDMLALRAEALAVLGDALVAAGRLPAAADALDRALAVARRKGDAATATRCQRTLQRLQAAADP